MEKFAQIKIPSVFISFSERKALVIRLVTTVKRGKDNGSRFIVSQSFFHKTNMILTNRSPKTQQQLSSWEHGCACDAFKHVVFLQADDVQTPTESPKDGDLVGVIC